jgi:hypothetical protein
MLMRTTIDLPEPLFHSLKLLTLQRRVSLKTFITQALEAALQAQSPAPTRMETPPIKRYHGVLPALSKHELASLLQSEDEGKAGLP